MSNIKASDLELKEKVVSIQRVAKVVKGGRRFSFSAIVVVGNENEVVGKYGGGLVLMKPASQGTGVIAGGSMRAVMESAGIKDVLAKSKGSSNPHNVVKATFDGLMKLRDPLAVAKQRGVSLKKVFNG